MLNLVSFQAAKANWDDGGREKCGYLLFGGFR
jgi:hypothetical protein